MSKKMTLVLTVLVVLLFTESQGNPVFGSENKEANPTVSMGSRITPRIGEWINFHRAWSFPSLTSVSSFFDDESIENDVSLVKKRIDNLENTQREITEIIKKMAQDISVISTLLNEKKPAQNIQTEGSILSIESVDKKNETSTENQTIPISIIGETNLDENRGQEPMKDKESEVAKKPVEFDELLPQKNSKPNLIGEGNINGENFTEPMVDQKITDKIETPIFENKPEVATSEKKNKSASMAPGFARSQGLRANGRMPWNKDVN